MNVKEILQRLESLGSPENVAGMARYGIKVKKAFGASSADIKDLAKELKKTATGRHALAQELWATEVHDARALAYLIDDPRQVTSEQMDSWANDFDNWAICDSTCGYLFSRTTISYDKAFEWARRDEEYVKRAGIVLMAWLAVHDKKASDEKIALFLPEIEKYADDDRNFVKKAVNWSLRQIGKRSHFLNGLAIETAERIKLQGTKPAKWIAADALRELRNPKTLERLKAKSEKQITRNGPK